MGKCVETEKESVIGIEDDSPIQSILCVKNVIDLEKIEETEDCFILEFNPFEQSVNDLTKLSLSSKDSNSVRSVDDCENNEELAVLREKSQTSFQSQAGGNSKKSSLRRSKIVHKPTYINHYQDPLNFCAEDLKMGKCAETEKECVSEIEDDSPSRLILCVKNVIDLKKIEETEECFILEFNPFEQSVDDLTKFPLSSKDQNIVRSVDDEEVAIQGKKGQITFQSPGNSKKSSLQRSIVHKTTSISCYQDPLNFCAEDLRVGICAETEKESVFEIEDDSPIRSIFCLKNVMDLEKIEEIEDCFILDFNPYEQSVDDLTKLSLSSKDSNSVGGVDDYENDEELAVLGEKGQVACRDYPHPRHLCANYPFDKTPHEQFCELCYCFICDTAAPCKEWNIGDPNLKHCDATKDDDLLRMSRRFRNNDWL